MKQYGVLNEKGEQFRCGNPVIVEDNDGVKHLFSYNTEIMTQHKDGKFYRVWTGWSQTTGKHIKAFCGLNKAGFDNLPFEN